MKLKCVGGVHDGEYVYLDNYYRTGDIVRVPEKLKPLYDIPHNLNELPEKLKVSYDMYKIDQINFSKDDFIMFLIPIKWTSKEAFIFQLNK